jgi:hypothetical protein
LNFLSNAPYNAVYGDRINRRVEENCIRRSWNVTPCTLVEGTEECAVLIFRIEETSVNIT